MFESILSILQQLQSTSATQLFPEISKVICQIVFLTEKISNNSFHTSLCLMAINGYQKNPVSETLDLFSKLFQLLNDPSNIHSLTELLQNIIIVTLAQLKSKNVCLDLLLSFTKFLHNTLLISPQLLLLSSQLEKITDFLVSALKINEVDIVVNIYKFFNSVFFDKHNSEPEWYNTTTLLFSKHGPPLIKELTTGLFSIQSQLIPTGSLLLFQIINKYKQQILPILNETFSQPQFHSLFSQVDMKAVIQAMISSPNIRKFKLLIIDLNEVLNGKQTPDVLIGHFI